MSAFPADYCELWTVVLEVKPPVPVLVVPSRLLRIEDRGFGGAPPAPSFPFSVVLIFPPARAKNGCVLPNRELESKGTALGRVSRRRRWRRKAGEAPMSKGGWRTL